MRIEAPASAMLRIDLDALASNYHLLKKQAAPAECSAVVKANAYGLGMVPIARRLLREGCTKFFVATLAEVAELRALAPTVSIYVLEGAVLAAVDELVALRATPVLSSLACSRHGRIF
jgi:alanine racemase